MSTRNTGTTYTSSDPTGSTSKKVLARPKTPGTLADGNENYLGRFWRRGRPQIPQGSRGSENETGFEEAIKMIATHGKSFPPARPQAPDKIKNL